MSQCSHQSRFEESTGRIMVYWIWTCLRCRNDDNVVDDDDDDDDDEDEDRKLLHELLTEDNDIQCSVKHSFSAYKIRTTTDVPLC